MTLALALLFAQTLGLMHGVVHGAGHVTGFVPEQGALDVDGNDNPNADDGLESLFSSHDGEQDCRLYDQASHGSAATPVALLNLPAVLPPQVVAIFQGEALARWSALFDARGPPLTL